MKSATFYRTKGGVIVEQRGHVVIADGVRKIAAYRYPTGGRHGLLRLDRLTRVKLAEIRAMERDA